MADRGIGVTTAQIKAAPPGAIYIWPARSSMAYAVRLAVALGRLDVTFINPSILDDGGTGLRSLTRPIVVDHAVDLTPDQARVLSWYRGR